MLSAAIRHVSRQSGTLSSRMGREVSSLAVQLQDGRVILRAESHSHQSQLVAKKSARGKAGSTDFCPPTPNAESKGTLLKNALDPGWPPALQVPTFRCSMCQQASAAASCVRAGGTCT